MSARGCADAIDACLDRERRDAAGHHASALDAYARREPSPCSAYVVARKRVPITDSMRSTASLKE